MQQRFVRLMYLDILCKKLALMRLYYALLIISLHRMPTHKQTDFCRTVTRNDHASIHCKFFPIFNYNESPHYL